MFLISVTQFHRPYARQEKGYTAIDDRYLEKSKRVQELGLQFTVEVLPTYQISVCLAEPELGDMLIEIVPLEQSIVPAIEKMLDEWTEEKYRKWSRSMIEAEGATWND